MIRICYLLCIKCYLQGLMFYDNISRQDDNRLKEHFKIPKGWSEAAILRKTDNTMANQKRTNGQAMICKTQPRKLKFEHHEPH
jgi:hypothetical protein